MPWQAIAADGPPQPAPSVRLRREFKGLTVKDLLADAGIDDQLPGVVRSALAAIDRGDLAAAAEALPGDFVPVLAGPGHDRRRARARVRWIALAALAAAAATATIRLL